jgi:hypothetical protein
VKLGVHPTFGASDQALEIPFLPQRWKPCGGP